MAVLGGAAALTALSVPAPGILGGRWPLFWMIMGLAALGALGAALLQRAPRRAALVVVILAGIVLPAVSFAAKAPLSDDLYRYSWDGTVQAAGIDPYDYPPDAPQLDRLHHAWLWPDDAVCAGVHRKPGCTLINRANRRTIYPPVAEVWFLLIHVTHADALRDRGVELVGFLVSLAILAACLALARDPRHVAWWAFAPFAALELTSDAHVDGLAVLFAVLAFLAARKDRPMLAAALIGLAALTKLYPAVLLFAVLTPGRRIRQIALVVGMFVVAYLPHVIAVGTRVIGYLPGYLREEDYGTGTRYYLLDLVGVKGSAATALVVLILLAVIAFVVVRRPDPLLGGVWLYGALLLVTTPVQPWYAAGLVALAACAARPEWIAVAVAAYAPFFAAILGGAKEDWGRLSYGLAAVLVLSVSVSRRAADRSRTPASPPRTPRPVRSPAR